MPVRSDHQLLRDYAKDGDEAAFRELVERHTNFVYSAALRQVAASGVAADLTQATFVDLARKARSVGERLAPTASLVGWLHRSTRYAVLNHLRDTRRRLHHERLAMEQLLTDAEPAADWEQIRPVLDEALDSLGDEDREALLLRYFKNQDYRAVGLALGVSDDTAQKRVSRAVERLREFFAQRGITVGASGLAVVITANAVQAAPVGLAVTISTAALLTGTAVSTSTVIAATKTMAMTTLQKTLVTVTVAILAGAGIYEARQAAQLRDQVQTLQQRQAPQAEQVQQLQRERDEATNRLSGMAAEIAKIQGNNLELLRLRGQVTLLRNELTKLVAENSKPNTDTSNTVDSNTEDPPYKRHAKLLVRYFDENPSAQIPEMKLISKDFSASIYGLAVKLAAQNDTANYGKQGFFDENRIKLETNEEYRRAASELRSYAEYSVAPMIVAALKEYLQANNGVYPKLASELQAFLSSPMDEAILQRYEIQPASNYSKIQAKYYAPSRFSGFVITPKTPVDEEFDHRIIIGPTSYMVGDPGSFKP